VVKYTVMSATLEQEIKLPFESAEAARAAVLAIGATPVHGRRLQEDSLLDTTNDDLRRRRSALRVRQDGGRSLLTFKGPVQPGTVKVREEIETVVGDGTVLMRILSELGFHVWFRYEKYREEFALDDCIIAIDETPVGVFVEIEGGDRGIAAAAQALGRSPDDYVLESYRGLFLRHCQEMGVTPTDMLFEAD
jgi:adenylate cyclase, class 2